MRWLRYGRNARPMAWRSKPRSSRMSGRHPLVASAGVSGSHVAVGKNCNPTGVAVEQTSNIARGTPGNPAELRSTIATLRCREASWHAGPMGSGVPRALHL